MYIRRVSIFILLLACCAPAFALLTPTSTVSIPMRDGKFLAADVYIPTACTSCPTILIQTPYSKFQFRSGLPMRYGENLESSPYIWVIVDWRGFYASAAAAVAQPNRGQDAYDVMDWIVAQTWSNGKIGTWGPSALGGVQYNAMKEHHPNHTCAVPIVAHPQFGYDEYFYGGVLEKSRLTQLDALGYGVSTVVLANPYYNMTWQVAENSTWYPTSIFIPTLQIGGWYDHNIDKMMDWYEATRTSADVAVRDEQWLLVGPWVHGGTGIARVGTSVQGELTYPNAEFKCDTMARNFFEYYLLNATNNWDATAPITFYEIGKNVWNTSTDASIETLTTSEVFLGPGSRLNSVEGTGSTSFTSDPRNPSPTLGGPTLSDDLDQGPYDQISLESRSDVVTFTSGDVLSDVTVSGRVKLQLHIQCDQPDADIAIRLVDVYPDGRNMLITDGIKRMRFRNGYRTVDEVFMTAGQVYPVEIELPFTRYTWKAGHEIKIFLSGNSALRWDVNLQDGGTMYTSGDTTEALIEVHHSALYPSKIVLPGNAVMMSRSEAVEGSYAVSISPNPASNMLQVKGAANATYVVSELSGKEIQSGVVKAETVDVSELKTGMYLIRIEEEGRSATKKFVRE